MISLVATFTSCVLDECLKITHLFVTEVTVVAMIAVMPVMDTAEVVTAMVLTIINKVRVVDYLYRAFCFAFKFSSFLPLHILHLILMKEILVFFNRRNSLGNN